MGLDMYLYRMPCYKNTTASEVSVIENYFDWMKAKKEGSKYADCTFKEWCADAKESIMYATCDEANIIDNLGFVSSSGYGDGSYICYTAMNFNNDKTVAIKIEFISEDDEEDEDE